MALSMCVLQDGRSRSVSPENPTGGTGAGGAATMGTGAAAARDLGRGWKVSPSVEIAPGRTHTVGEIAGPGVIRHMWLTVPPGKLRSVVLRVYWDGAAEPAIAVPLGDFFCQGWASFAQVSSLPVAVNPMAG
jgi:D-arabinan exo alpha-(1,3)/(1,5)-arabinofuranosidase (non-reducing end)